MDENVTLKNAYEALNGLILDNDKLFDEKQIIKIIRFKQWLIDQENK